MTSQSAFALEFLSELERRESELLSWGLVTGYFTESELTRLASDFINESGDGGRNSPFLTADELIDWLLDHVLIVALPTNNDGDLHYRTRIAEGLRLLSTLRQMFDPKDWRGAPNLVADFRFILVPRRYPVRNWTVDQTIDRLRLDGNVTSLQESVIRALLSAGTPHEWRLANFQVESTSRILFSEGSAHSEATIVCAGTGTGKTMSFYLPVFGRLAVRDSNKHTPTCLALYPRNELLKDQLCAAIGNAKRVNQVFTSQKQSGISIGVLYGDVPYNANNLLTPGSVFVSPKGKWDQTSQGFICPFLRCPSCTDQMIWNRSDCQNNRERLHCLNPRCPTVVDEHEIRITRDRLRQDPPDILFTTTEMLNRQMASSDFGPLFGIGTPAAPDFVLLDEAHSYEGVHGAHVALTLARWRHLSQARPHFVALSATLSDATNFMSNLTGVFSNRVELIQPVDADDQEWVVEGMEYLIALRGDPVSGASLLSTTIQSGMVINRILDNMSRRISNGAFGTKNFLFTDKLDVTNRLYDQLRDAEGHDPRRHRAVGSLANCRGTTQPDHMERWEVGQSWDMCEEIGHNLASGMTPQIIDRTSSQDAGLNRNATAVVATASLELGMDDPDVGAIIQHKAPQSAAAYLQRKGRAGRSRQMRPITVVVLSDYGRDRLVYQGYERLLSPELPPKTLPIRNRFVLRIQATFALISWLTRGVNNADGWDDLRKPARHSLPLDRQKRYRQKLVELLNDREKLRNFTSYLSSTLGISRNEKNEIEALLWEPPRAIMTVVIPTLLRRLESGWKNADGSVDPDSKTPLPEFLPATLFSDLNLPEVRIVYSDGRGTHQEAWMPIRQGLSEFAPGRVSRRFAVRGSNIAHWITPGAQLQGPVALNDICGNQGSSAIGRFSYFEQGNIVDIDVYRPSQITINNRPHDILDTSNSLLSWRTQIVPSSSALSLMLPVRSNWSKLITGIEFYLHNHGNAIEVRRFATSAQTSVSQRNGSSVQRFENSVAFVDDQDPTVAQPIGLGFAVAVDAICLHLELPDSVLEARIVEPALERGLRCGYFRHQVEIASELEGRANEFLRAWLADVFLAAVIHEAVTNNTSLSDALVAIQNQQASLSLSEILAQIFQTLPEVQEELDLDDNDDRADSAHGVHTRNLGKRHQEILDLLSDRDVVNILVQAAQVLLSPIDSSWYEWIRNRIKETFGAAILAVCERLCSELNASDLYVDLDPGPRLGSTNTLPPDEIWLTESTIGGAGYVESVLTKYSQDPRRFFHLLDAELEPSDLEEVDSQLQTLLALASSTNSVCSDLEVQDSLAGVRNGKSHQEIVDNFSELRSLIQAKGIYTSHAVMSAISARILRPGTSVMTDNLMHSLIQDWIVAENQINLEISPRVFALLKSGDTQLDNSFGHTHHLPTNRSELRSWRFSTLVGLFWPRGSDVRAEALGFYNPFSAVPRCDRQLLLAIRPNEIRDVTLDENLLETVRQQLTDILTSDGVVLLNCSANNISKLRTTITDLMINPLVLDNLIVHPRVRGCRRRDMTMSLLLDLPEAVQ
jgi:ATP-dependent helicase Lhr and Lhr-like helicase